MSGLLTSRAEERAEKIVVLLRMGSFAFIGYALSLHVSWQDAVAATLALVLILSAVRLRSES